MKYSANEASAYKELGIENTTHALGLLPTQEIFGNLSGKTVLDFGTGTGRTARFLKSLGAAKVIGVDKDQNMLSQATEEVGIEYQLVADTLSLGGESIDAALCASVFVEMSSLDDILAACKEINRVLRKGAPFIVITTSPNSIGADFLSWRYDKQDNLKSGDKITCHIKGTKPFDIQDYYWTKQDHVNIFEQSGFAVKDILLPTASGDGWLDETKVAPQIIFSCIKKET